MELIAIVLSAVAIVISIWVRADRPRLTVTLRSFALTTIGEDRVANFRSIIEVRVINDGGSPARIGEVFLEGVDSRLRIPFDRRELGPKLPAVVEADGGQEAWHFSYDKVHQAAVNQLREDPQFVRGAVRKGTRIYRSKGRDQITPRGHVWQSRRQKLAKKYRAWRYPMAHIFLSVPPSKQDIASKSYEAILDHDGGRALGRSELRLVAHYRDGRPELVAGVDPVPVPRIRRGRSKRVRLPLVESVADDVHHYSWDLRTRQGRDAGGGTADTLAEAIEMNAKIESGDTDGLPLLQIDPKHFRD